MAERAVVPLNGRAVVKPGLLAGTALVRNPSEIRDDTHVLEVTDLPIIPNDVLGVELPPPMQARFLEGNWFGRGHEIVLWHPVANLQAMCPLAMRHEWLTDAIAELAEAAEEALAKRAIADDGGEIIDGA